MFVVDWILSDRCNLNCTYCLQGVDTRNAPCESIDFSFMGSVPKNSVLFHLTGGEPFLVPNFTDICNAIVASENQISINTNLTINPQKFIGTIDRDKVAYINASVHYPYRDKCIGPYVRHYKMLRDAGFFIVGNCVMVPQQMNAIIDFINNVRNEYGISIFPKLMRGVSNKISYPKGYSDIQITEIKRLTAIAEADAMQCDVCRFEYLSKFSPSIDIWKSNAISKDDGMLCFDGSSRIHLDSAGNWIICDGSVVGNVYRDGFKLPFNIKSTCPFKTANNNKQYCSKPIDK